MTDATGPTMDQARAAKKELLDLCCTIPGTAEAGIGLTEDGSSIAVTLAVADRKTAALIPTTVSGVPVRTYLSSGHVPYAAAD